MRSTHEERGRSFEDMKLYFSPLACSLASKITVYEAGAEDVVSFVEVDPETKKTVAGGDDFTRVSRLGLVPALVQDDGALLTENGAILQALARRFASAKLAPEADDARALLQMYLSFVGTELHKLLAMLLDKHAPAPVKEYATTKVAKRLSWIDGELEGKEYLLGTFSVADAYLFTVLNWTLVLPVKLDAYPNLTAFMTRMRARPAVARAFDEERRLYVAELARHGEV